MLNSDMASFDYDAPADLYPSRSRKGNRPAGFRRFNSAAEAIRYAIEEMSSDFFPGTVMECEEERFDSVGIMELYRSSAYPLARKLA
jgi:hypothetical protein